MSHTALLRHRAASQPKRILLPENQDPRVLEAASELIQKKIAVPVFLQSSQSKSLVDVEVFANQPNQHHWRQRAVAELTQALIKKGKSPTNAATMLEKNTLLLTALLLNMGYVDGVVCGSLASTGDVLRAGIQGLGLSETGGIVTSCFLIELAERTITFGDCAVIPHPDSTQLAKIAIACAKTHRILTGEEPKVAMLSFSTKGSASDTSIHKIHEAIALFKQLEPQIKIDGELQFDAAFVPWIGKCKAPNSVVAGQANVFIFPDLQAGNIGYKIAERLGNARAIGPITQGFAKPWLDLSRGCSIEDIVDATAIASLLASTNFKKA